MIRNAVRLLLLRRRRNGSSGIGSTRDYYVAILCTWYVLLSLTGHRSRYARSVRRIGCGVLWWGRRVSTRRRRTGVHCCRYELIVYLARYVFVLCHWLVLLLLIAAARRGGAMRGRTLLPGSVPLRTETSNTAKGKDTCTWGLDGVTFPCPGSRKSPTLD